MGTPTINAILRGAGNSSDYDYRDIRRLLRTANPKQVRQLFKESGRFVDRAGWMLRDTMRTWELVRAEDPNFRLDDLTFSGWDGLHDTLSAQQRLIRTKNHEVEHSEEWLSLAG